MQTIVKHFAMLELVRRSPESANWRIEGRRRIQ